MHILPKEGRFIAGVCHAREKLDCIAAANIRWNREDVPFPFQPGKFGELTPAYIAYRDKVRRCAARGPRSWMERRTLPPIGRLSPRRTSSVWGSPAERIRSSGGGRCSDGWTSRSTWAPMLC